MTTYERQIEVTRAANMAARAIADASEAMITELADSLHRSKITIEEFETESIKIVKQAYKESSEIGRDLTIQMSEIDQWVPLTSMQDTEYLNSLVADVKRNVEMFKNSPQDNKDFRNLALRVKLSAVTGATRGLTDSQLAHYSELVDFGYSVKKLWVANFANNEPCVDCIHLHGTQVKFNSEFPIPTLMKTSVYRDLKGPPLHVRCKCTMVILISNLGNAMEQVIVDTPTNPTMMSTKTVKRLPQMIFEGIIKALRAITGKGKKK